MTGNRTRSHWPTVEIEHFWCGLVSYPATLEQLDFPLLVKIMASERMKFNARLD